MRARRTVVWLAAASALIGIASVATLVTHAAMTATLEHRGNSLSSGTVNLGDNDQGAAMLSLSNAQLGASDTSCIRTTSSGSLDSTVRHYASVSGDLAPYLNLKVTRGSGASGFDDCTGFTADSTNYTGAGAGVLYDGKLSSYPTSYGGGRVDPTASPATPAYPSMVLATSGLVSFWRLDGSAAGDSKGTNNGTINGGVTTGVPGAFAGSADTAFQFDGVNDFVRVSRQIQDDFSIEFWFKSTQGSGANSQWWGNAGLVDAEVSGAGSDFGTSLRSDGKITAGAGAPDTTVVSGGGFNDGEWHHVVFTRVKASGGLSLYVDGKSVGSATGPTASLTGPAHIDFGRIQSGTNYFAGTIDEVAVYDTALSANTVESHFADATDPEVWTNGESHDYRFQITVADDSAAQGKSATASFHWEARNR